jgi:hypothetical protein
MNYRKVGNITGWVVFAIATIVYFFSVERTGSLWDCGEFIAGAYKLQVVHPPGAPLFLLIGRMFTWVAEIFSDNPEDIAFAVNMMSGICTAFAATFVSWVTFLLGKLALVGREDTPDNSQTIALAGAALVAGLTTTFATSIWFSAVEGEVYAMSTFFTALVLWAVIRWFTIPKEDKSADRWLLFAIYAAGLSIGVHLLSILTFPALALFYYFKKYKKHTLGGMAAAAGIGVVFIVAIQTLIIVGVPNLWGTFELLTVNTLGLPQHSGIVPTILLIGGTLSLILAYIHGAITSKIPLYALGGIYLLLSFTSLGENADTTRFVIRFLSALLLFGIAFYLDKVRYNRRDLQMVVVAATLLVIAYSTIGIVVIRANANTPINMNQPSDAMRLLPYLNREQYGERALLKGPHFDAKPVAVDTEDRYGYVESSKKYEVVDRKVSYVYDDRDKMLFPRMSDYSQGRPNLYRNEWMGGKSGRPSMADNISFLWSYQLGWMYWRYFLWNFAGRQNGDQGFTPANVKDGNWMSGISFYDEGRLYNLDEEPDFMKNNKARNYYYMLPVLFGLLGLFFHATRRREEFMGLLGLFIITGIGIIIYSNQPPHEPRERDYVLAGSFFTYAIWIGMGVLAIFDLLRNRFKLGTAAAPVAALLVLSAPLLMGTQNFDDHSRMHHKGSRDYASNFLRSVDENAIIFTYGDNDTYPLWYCQEVEGIRTDVRVVNLSLIAVDWYIDQLRRKVNDSPPINMSIAQEALRGYKRNQVPVNKDSKREISVLDALKFVEQDHSNEMRVDLESYLPSSKLYIPVNKQKVLDLGIVPPEDSSKIVDKISFTINKNNLLKGDLAVMDIIASNTWDRPVYFAVTCRQSSMLGLQDYTQLEGLALRIVPVKSSSRNRPFGMVGNGKVNVEKTFEIITDKWKWGNFDKKDLFVDRSYGPSIQSMQLIMMRTIEELLREGDKERAIQLTDQYFEAFPNMNFTYNFNTLSVINYYLEAGDEEKAKTHLRILADEVVDKMEFFYSLDPKLLDPETGSFGAEFRYANLSIQQMKSMLQNMDDEAFRNELNEMFAEYDISRIQD